MRRIVITFMMAGAVWGQVPADFQDLYGSLQQKLNTFDASILSQWNGTKSNVDFSAELLSANCNRGLQLLTARQGYLAELGRLKALGVNTVTVCAGFPILYQPSTSSTAIPGITRRCWPSISSSRRMCTRRG